MTIDEIIITLLGVSRHTGICIRPLIYLGNRYSMRIHEVILKVCVNVGLLFKLVGDFVTGLPTALIPRQKMARIIDSHWRNTKKAQTWSNSSDAGLTAFETDFIGWYGIKRGSFLVIASGGGREAFGLAKLGFEITAIDLADELIEFSKLKARRENINNISFQCVSMYEYDPQREFDYVFFSGNSYGLIPSRELRIEMLEKIKTWLTPNGKFLLSFRLEAQRSAGMRKYFYSIYRIIAYATFGNRHLQRGDRILGGGEWCHDFSDREEITSEVRDAGFRVDKIDTRRVPYMYLTPQNNH